MDGQDQNPDKPAGHVDFQPGETISPRSEAAPEAPAGPYTLESPVAKAAADSEVVPPNDDIPGEAVPPQMQETDERSEISWLAPEFIVHDKSPQWYAALAGVTAVGLVLAYLWTRDWFTPVVVIICAVLFGVAASRQPRQLEYTMDGTGIQIGQRYYPYHEFRSFAVLDEGAFSSIVFMPLKRFGPPLSILFDSAQEPSILEVLSGHLPLDHHKLDAVDSLMRRIRF